MDKRKVSVTIAGGSLKTEINLRLTTHNNNGEFRAEKIILSIFRDL
jgi:hypothetical protein